MKIQNFGKSPVIEVFPIYGKIVLKPNEIADVPEDVAIAWTNLSRMPVVQVKVLEDDSVVEDSVE